MRLRPLAVDWEMTLRRLARNRMALLLLFLVPAVFFAAIVATTPERRSWMVLASVAPSEAAAPPGMAPPSGALVRASERQVGLLYVGLAAVGVLSAFLGLNVIQGGAGASRRLVLAGYRPWELLAAKLLALACVAAVVGGFVGALLRAFFAPERPGALVAGLVLCGIVYACYGLLVGAAARSDLVGILGIVLLANLDAGWLQSPAYYADAPLKALIRWLPAHLPAQVAMVGAFTQYPVHRQVLGSLAYAAALLVAAAAVFTWRVRLRRRPS